VKMVASFYPIPTIVAMSKIEIKTACLLLFLSTQLFPYYCQGQETVPDRTYRIEHLTTEDGLSQNTIDCIFKDSRGFMWFGTWNGLNRYDGYKFVIYKKEDDINSISNNFIHSLCEDKQGNLWIATRNGLNRFDYKKDRFTPFFHDSLGEYSLSDNWINVVYCDRQGMIWIGTSRGGLHRLDTSNTDGQYKFIHYQNNLTDALSISSNDIRSIIEDTRGRLWIGTADGLNLMEPKNGKFRIFRPDPQNSSSLSAAEIRCIFEDHAGTIWIGTSLGLNRWVEGSRNFIRYIHNPDDPRTLSHFVVNEITEDIQHNLYIATLGGIDILDSKENTFSHISVNTKANYSLNNEFINSIYCDNSGLIWVGTDKGGVNKFNVNQKEFRFLSNDPDDQNSLSNNTVNSIMDEIDVLWVGTAGGGLNRYDKKTGLIKYYANNPHRYEGISSNFITSIYRDRSGDLWIGTWGMGFDKMVSPIGAGRFVHQLNNPANPKSLVNNFVSTLYEDKEGNFWVGTEGGLDLFRKESGTFRHICNSPQSPVMIREVGCLLRDMHGNLWIGTRNGLFFIDNDQLQYINERNFPDEVICFKNNPDDSASLSENYVISLFEDIQGNIWIGTFGNGLNKLVSDKKVDARARFIHYTQRMVYATTLYMAYSRMKIIHYG
jgi:ligand-binding sensor domain-containing protein